MPIQEDTAGAVAAYLDPAANQPARAAKMSMQVAIDANPDFEAELRRASARTGVPLESARAFPDDVKRQAAVESHDYDALAAQFPSTTKFLADPENARISHDDVANMSALEGAISFIGKSGSALASSIPRFNASAWGLAQATSESVISPVANMLFPGNIGNDLTKWLVAARKKQTGYAEDLTPKSGGNIEAGWYSGLQSLGQNLLMLPAAIATGQPQIALGGMAATTGGDAYGKARDKGVSVPNSIVYGSSQAAIEYATEKLPLKQLLGDLKLGTGMIKTLGAQMALEIPGEQIATVLQDLNDWAVLNPEKPFREYLAERPDAAAQTLVATIVGTGGQVGALKSIDAAMGRLSGRSQEAQHAAGVGDALIEFNTLAEASKVRERDTGTAQAFFQSLMQDGRDTVWITPQALAESGMLDQIVQAVPGVAEQLAQADQTGTEIKIPIADLMANLAGPELAQSIIPHLADEPGGFTQTTANEYMQSGAAQELAEEVSRTLAAKQQDDAFTASKEVVTAGVLEQLAAAGRFAPEVNQAYASMVGNFFAVQAARLGITPEEMAARYPLQVKAEAMPGARTLSQSGLSFTFDSTGAQSGQSDMRLTMKDGDKVGGSIDYSVFEGRPAIKMIGVAKNARRKGYATKLLQRLQSEFPDTPIDWGMLTEDGAALKKSIKMTTKERPEIAAKQKELADFIAKRDAWQQRSDEFYALENPTEEQSAAFREWITGISDEWNDLHDRIYELEQDTYGESATYDLIDTDNTLAQGERGSFNPDTNTISLLQGADLSTFLHESGHFFLEVMNDVAGRADAPTEMRADMDALLKWFGVADLATWNSYDIEQKRGHHEAFARGFEAYLFEGKAPTAELQGLLARFRSWMVNVYKSLAALNVQLTPEVRAVFDRMIASTEAITQAERDAGMAGLFGTKPEFMSDDEWAAYRALSADATQEAAHHLETRGLRDMQWLANAKAKLLSKMQRDAADKRKAVRDEVAAEVMAEPINQARTFLKRGEQKLAIDSLVEMYGGEGDKFARLDWEPLGYGQYGMLAKDGITPDIAAEMFGFQSGDELVRALLGEENTKAKIEGITDQRMLERHGDLIDEQSIDRAVNAALHASAHTRFLATELNALNKALGRRAVLVQAAKSYAETAIARTAIKDLRPDLFTAAAKRAAKASETAFKKGDLQTAAAEKQAQLINTYAAKAAMDARDEVKKIATRFTDIANGKNETVGKTRDMDMVHATRAILAEFGIGSRGKKAAEYLAAVDAYDPGMAAVLRDRIEAATENAGPFKLLTVEQVRGLRDEIESLWFLAKRSRQMEVDGDLLDREEVQAQLRERLEEIGIPDLVPGEGQAITPGEVRLSMLQSLRASMRRVEAWTSTKDGNTPMGPFRKFIWNTIKDPADAYRADKAKYLKQLRALLAPIAPSLKQVLIAAPEIGYTFGKDEGGMGKVELLHAILHTGNAGNKRKLLLGRHWASEGADGEVDTSRWDAFVQRMVREGMLTKADFDFAQGVWDMLEEMKPVAQKAHRAVFGRYFDEVTADPFEIVLPNTGGGTQSVAYRGGYVPAIADSRIVSDAKTRALMEEEAGSLMNVLPSTSKGFTKSRVEYNSKLHLDLRLLAQHVDKVLLFSHMEQPIRDVRRVLTSPAVARPLNRIDPAAFDGLLTPWLNRTARQQVETPVAGSNGLMRFFSVVRQRAGMAAMFANVSNTAQQITGFSIALLKVKPVHLMSAAAEFVRSPRQMAEAVAEASPYMANRMENEVSAMSDAINDILLNPGVYDSAVNWTKKHTYFMQSAVDNVMGPIIWHGAYNQALETAPADLTDDQLKLYARRLADSAVRETQGSTLPEDVSRIETGNAFVRLFTQFAGYFNMQANILGTEFAKVSQDVGLRKGAGRGFYILLVGFLVPAWAATAIALAFRGGPEDEDKDGAYIDDWLAQVFGWGVLRNATAMVPVIGQTANSLANTFNKKPYDDKISTSPAISMIESAVSVPSDVYKLATGAGSPTKTVRDVATLISITVGLPANALARPAVFATEVATGKAKPTGPADTARGVISGVASPASKGR